MTIRRTMALACAFLVATQATDASDNISGDYTEAWAQQQRCWSAWDHLVADWKQHGGGLRQSIVSTRHQISEDRTSKFAAIVRAAWVMQETSVSRDQFGHWPVGDSDYRIVGHAVADAAKPYLHEETCRGAYWLDAVFWDEMRGVDGDPTKARSMDEMPNTVQPQDAHSAAGWVTYWLFVRTEI